MSALRHDLKYALRTLRASPGFAAMAIVMIAAVAAVLASVAAAACFVPARRATKVAPIVALRYM